MANIAYSRKEPHPDSPKHLPGIPSGNVLTLPTMVTRSLIDIDKHAAIRALAQLMLDVGRVTDLPKFLTDAVAREDLLATGLPGGIAIPHCRSGAVITPSVAVGISEAGVDFGAEDGPAHLILLIAAPDGQDEAHLRILANLSRRLVHREFVEQLVSAESNDQVAQLINGAVTRS